MGSCFVRLATVAVLLLPAAAPAAAQQAGALSVDEIRTCLCEEPRLEAARAEIATRRAILDERQAQLGLLEGQIAQHRRTLDPSDVIGQELLKNTMAQAAALRDLIQSDVRPSVNQAVADYNVLAAGYTDSCAARPRYAHDVEQAKQNLSCPQP